MTWQSSPDNINYPFHYGWLIFWHIFVKVWMHATMSIILGLLSNLRCRFALCLSLLERLNWIILSIAHSTPKYVHWSKFATKSDQNVVHTVKKQTFLFKIFLECCKIWKNGIYSNILTHWSMAHAGSNDEKIWRSKILLDCPLKKLKLSEIQTC